MTEYKFENNAIGNLDTAIGTGDTTLNLESGDGARFPALTAGQVFRALIYEDATTEWITVTGISGDILTAVRGPVPQSFNIGAFVELRLEDQALDNFFQKGLERTVGTDPDGSLAALYFGEEVYQSVSGVWWKNTTGTEWKEMNL